MYRASICESGDNASLAVNIATDQKRRGSDGCRDFAAAFALHAALHGSLPRENRVRPVIMRNNLLKCFQFSTEVHHQKSQKSMSYPRHGYRCVLQLSNAWGHV